MKLFLKSNSFEIIALFASVRFFQVLMSNFPDPCVTETQEEGPLFLLS